jgi:hypothetical protein
MCHPAAWAGASLAIGAAQAVSKYGAQQADAAAQLSQRYNAEVARAYEVDQITARQRQEHDASTQAQLDNAIRANKAVATVEAQAADAGVEGNSVESIARDFYRQQGRIDSTTQQNTKMSVQQLQEEKKGAEARFRQRTNFAEVRRPSLMGLGLEIAGAGVNAYELYDRRQNPFGRGSTK